MTNRDFTCAQCSEFVPFSQEQSGAKRRLRPQRRRRVFHRARRLTRLRFYILAGAMLLCFAYLAWASRQSQRGDKEKPEKK